MREQCLFFAISGPELCLDEKSAGCQAGTLWQSVLQHQIQNGRHRIQGAYTLFFFFTDLGVYSSF